MLAQSVLFIAIFAGLAVVWERDLGITQRVLVTPVARSAVILGKAAGAGTRAAVHVGVVLVAVALARIPVRWSVSSVLGTLAFSALGATVFASLSMVIASAVRSREQFMGLGQLITLPLLFASNALYAVSLMPGWMQAIAWANPLTYQVEALRWMLVGIGPDRLAVDLGGGHGEYSLEFARRGVKATLQDRLTMIEIARAAGRLEAAGVELLAGDFFETLPEVRSDVVFVSGVTHTIPGERVTELLRRAAAIVAPGGLLAVHTFLRGRHRTGAIFAIQMLANGGGRDTHGEDDYRRWLAEAGFAPPEVVDIDEGRRTVLLSRATGQTAERPCGY